jgi:hypothetical protein
MSAIYDKAGGVSAKDGFVFFKADGVDLRITPDAAIKLSGMLLSAGYEASGQKYLASKGKAS